ncbi:MAG: hypothetical protein COV26_02085 [Candidatus Nealsonbacteria bacterium CG10_big_fil_rev_8_21_14_0_10_36_23]|uniref:50S ribosomal protein L35 n=1 Tax=Candidatus Nealsonbacteria bacterium CG10_big_fil_rev_8_21_14_0_10_36_23 TaxID=1974709 RepID=A0A2H0TKX0_9BACT|nr:MAG: hypothetical protein COV26_02085 [Candidatus Nealsonbacteria bacterium CG10_big_fil_rev_8_21_14_0_10_36_23]
MQVMWGMKKKVSKRLKITKTGKVLRRTMGQCHFRAKKTTTQIKRRQKMKEVGIKMKILNNL